MDSLTTENHFTKVSPLQSLIFLTLITFTGFAFIGPFLGFAVAIPFFDGGFIDMVTAMNDPVNNESVKVPMFIAQAFSTIIGFIVMPYLYGIMVLNIRNHEIIGKSIPTPIMSLLVMIIVISFMGVNSIFIEWNATVELPEILSGFEQWARNFEDRAQEITQFLTQFDSNSQFILAFFVIAVLPAIGEEFVFRGLLQNHLNVITKNLHVAVWLAAILFSFFHMQFYGFVPRIILGALFGYLYAWSGNLAYPIIAHFVNNGFTLLMMYLYNKGAVDFDIESTESVPVSTVLISAGVTAVLLYIFKGYFRKEEKVYE
jgi:membrane protease YdiL (CAAX protease family)